MLATVTKPSKAISTRKLYSGPPKSLSRGRQQRLTIKRTENAHEWKSEISDLLDSVQKLRPDGIYVASFGTHKQWTWIMNGTKTNKVLGEPIQGPVTLMQHILPRHIFILFEGKLIGFLNESGGGWGEKGKNTKPTIYDMVAEFQTDQGIFDAFETDGVIPLVPNPKVTMKAPRLSKHNRP